MRLFTSVRDALVGDPRAFGASRSSGWSSVRNSYLEQYDFCAVCGYKKNLNVHHIKPFHLFPDLELDPDNLITLGEKCPTGNHHLFVGHLGNWASFNEKVVHDASYWLHKIRQRPTANRTPQAFL